MNKSSEAAMLKIAIERQMEANSALIEASCLNRKVSDIDHLRKHAHMLLDAKIDAIVTMYDEMMRRLP